MNKEGLRKIAIANRDTLPPATRETVALRVRDRFLDALPLPKGASISAYMPMQSEISALPLAEALLSRGHTMLMPRTPDNSMFLEFRTWTLTTPMSRTLWGILEPEPRHSATRIPDVLIMPVLAFDAAGNRLGYGAGYIDQTLKLWHGKIPFLTVGIAHQSQFYETVPVEGHDHALDFCITDEKLYQFRQSADIWWV